MHTSTHIPHSPPWCAVMRLRQAGAHMGSPVSAAPCRPRGHAIVHVLRRPPSATAAHRPPWSVRGRQRLWLCRGSVPARTPKPLPNALGAKSLCVTARVTPGTGCPPLYPPSEYFSKNTVRRATQRKFGIRSSYIFTLHISYKLVSRFYITQASTYS